tara:strand:+ start:3316 stop:6078 length:2763 start_codon:yes stop_codon:yes gene_type:complete
VAENKPTQEQLAEIDARLAAAQPTAEQQAQIDARLAAVNEQEMQEAEAARLAARSNAQRAFEEQGLTDRVPGVINTIDRTLSKVPGVKSLNRFLSQTLDSAALDYLPDSAKNYLAELGVGLPAGVNAEGMAGKMGEAVGMAAPYVAFPLAAGERLAAETAAKLTPRMNMSPVRGFLEDMYQTYLKSPKMFLATETGGAAGAAAFGELLGVSEENKEEYSPERIVTQRLFAELLGGGIGSGIPNALPSTFKRAKQTIQATLLPFTDAGASVVAARQMQARAGSQEQRELFALLLEGMPEGVTPAQWLGDDTLLAQQARILADDRADVKNTRGLTEQVGAQLMQARRVMVEELYDAQGNPRSRLDWARQIIQRVTPGDTKIEKDQVDKMLQKSYDAFKPLYDKARGFELDVEDADGLREVVIGSADAPSITASDDSINTARRWLRNLVTNYEPEAAKDLAALDTPPPVILGADGKPLRPPTEAPAPEPKAPLNITSTNDAINIRSKIREERRRLRKKGGNQEVRDLYGVAEEELTNFIRNNVSDEAAEELAETDAIYSQYKVIEDAVFQSFDDNLTGQNVSQSIKQSTLATQSQLARGDTNEAVQELRSLALQGRDVETYLRDPERAALIVRGLEPEEKAQVQSEFLRYIITRAKEVAPIIETPVPGVGTQKEVIPSAETLKRDLLDNLDVMRSLGMSDDEIKRVTNIADTLGKLEKPSPEAVKRLFDDGPADLLELAAVLVGTGQAALIGDATNVGGSLVLAQFMANRARKMLSFLTSDQAAKLMADATTDPELYSVLMLKDIAPNRKLIEGAKYLQNYLYSAPFSALGELEEGEERPLAPADPLFIEDEQASVSAPDPRPQARGMLRRIPTAPSTRGLPGLGSENAPSPEAIPTSAVAQGPANSQSREMMQQLFPEERLA